jgi:hypothetical protein
MLAGAIIVIIIIVILALIIIFGPYLKKKLEKKFFIKKVYRHIYRIAVDYDYYLINDIALEIDTKLIHFNQILFGEKYIYCIGNIYQDGSLSGKFIDAKWLKYHTLTKVEHINNPLLLHKTRKDYLSSALNVNDMIVGILVVNDSILIDKIEDIPNDMAIVNLSSLRNFIKQKESEDVAKIDPIQLENLVSQINKKNLDPTSK